MASGALIFMKRSAIQFGRKGDGFPASLIRAPGYEAESE